MALHLEVHPAGFYVDLLHIYNGTRPRQVSQSTSRVRLAGVIAGALLILVPS